jgi:hypothetical protein
VAAAEDSPDPLMVLTETGDVIPLRTNLDNVGFDVAALDRLPQWDRDVTVDFGAELRQHRRAVDAVLHQALQRARADYRSPHAMLWLLAYVIHLCQAARMASHRFEPICQTMVGLRDLWRHVDTWDHVVIAETSSLLIGQLDGVLLEIRAENAVNSGRLIDAAAFYEHSQRTAESALAHTHQFLRRHFPASALENAVHGAAVFVEDWAQVAALRSQSSSVAAQGLAAFLTDGVNLDAARAPLSDVLSMAKDQADPSEDWSGLRANSLDLGALARRRDDPWLYIDNGTIVYVYPFGLRGVRFHAASSPVDGSRELHGRFEKLLADASSTAQDWLLAGVTPRAIHTGFPHSDMWESADSDGRRFDGLRIELPAVHLQARGGDEPLAALRAEIRLSKLGNHYLRFEGPLYNSSPLDTYFALARAAPGHGALVVRFATNGDDDDDHQDLVARPVLDANLAWEDESHRAWPRLADLAMELIADLAARLEARHTARAGKFQVLVTIDAASTRAGPSPSGSYTDLDAVTQLRNAAGAATLYAPARNVTPSLAPWSRYQVDDEVVIPQLPTHAGRELIRTINTTIHIGLGTPAWELNSESTISEFVASLDGMFASWMDQLSDFQGAINLVRSEVSRESNPSAAFLMEGVEWLRWIRLNLQAFVTDCRSTIALIESPALVAMPTAAAELAATMTAAGLPRRAQDFDRRAIEILADQLGEVVERLAHEREDIELEEPRRAERRRELRNGQVAIFAAVGFSGLVQIFQAFLNVSDRMATRLAVGGAIILGVAALILILRAEGAVARRRARIRRLQQRAVLARARKASAEAYAAAEAIHAAAHEAEAAIPRQQRRRSSRRPSKSKKR